MNHCSLGVGREQLWQRDGGGEFTLVFSSTGVEIYPRNPSYKSQQCRNMLQTPEILLYCSGMYNTIFINPKPCRLAFTEYNRGLRPDLGSGGMVLAVIMM